MHGARQTFDRRVEGKGARVLALVGGLQAAALARLAATLVGGLAMRLVALHVLHGRPVSEEAKGDFAVMRRIHLPGRRGTREQRDK